MIKERIIAIPRAQTLLQNALLENNVGPLISQRDEKNTLRLRGKLQESINGLDELEIVDLSRRILNGLATENQQWTKDRRDGALVILSLIPIAKLDPFLVTTQYLNALKNQNNKSDPYGTVDGLLEAGIILSSVFVALIMKDTTKKDNKQIKEMSSELKRIENLFSQDQRAHDYLKEKIKAISGNINQNRRNGNQSEADLDKLDEQIVKLRKQGEQRNQIAEAINMTPGYVRKRIVSLIASGKMEPNARGTQSKNIYNDNRLVL